MAEELNVHGRIIKGLQERILDLESKLAAAEEDKQAAVLAEREACAKAADEYRWNDLHNTCCEGNMGWLLGKVSAAIRARTTQGEKP